MSNKLDSEVIGRKPSKRPHREVVGAAIVDSELLGKVIQRVKAVGGIKAFLVLPVTALHFSVMAWRIRADELVADAQLGSGRLKQSRQVTPAVGKAVGEFKAIVRLDALHPDSSAAIPFHELFEEISGGVSGLLRVGRQKAQTCELVNGGVLVKPKLWNRDTAQGDDFHIYLNTLARIGHLFVRLGLICLFLLGLRKHPQFPHDPEQALRAAGIAALPEPVPQLHHAEIRVSAAHIPDQFQLRLCVLIGMAVRAFGVAGQRGLCSIPAGLPEVDVRPALVVLPAGAADAVFFCVFH